MTDRTVRSVLVACLLAASAGAQSARQASGPTLLREAAGGPKPRIIIEPPLAAPLSFGTAVVGYQTRGLQVAPVFGPAALAVSPRVGHVHVSVDDAPWVWANTSGQPVIVRGLLPGRHKVVMQLVNASHQPLDRGAVEFTVPERVKAPVEAATRAAPVDAARTQPAAKLFIDSPLPEPLSRGVIIIPYRTENVQLVPVFGPQALALSPRVGHLRVTVDDTPWHWLDGSGNAVIVAGLSPGAHKILLHLSNANHEPVDAGVVQVTVPTPRPLPPAQ